MRLLYAAVLSPAAGPALANMSACNALATNIEMTACAGGQYEVADAELNDVWRQVIASIQATDADIMPAAEEKVWQKAMTEAQRAWATFKDEDCSGGVSHEWYGGSGANLAVAACLYGHTVTRTKELRERYLNN